RGCAPPPGRARRAAGLPPTPWRAAAAAPTAAVRAVAAVRLGRAALGLRDRGMDEREPRQDACEGRAERPAGALPRVRSRRHALLLRPCIGPAHSYSDARPPAP